MISAGHSTKIDKILLLQLQKGHAFVSEPAEELEMNLTTIYSAVTRLAERNRNPAIGSV